MVIGETYKVQELIQWFKEFDVSILSLHSRENTIDIGLIQQQLPHLLGLQYMGVLDSKNKKITGQRLLDYVVKNKISDQSILKQIKNNIDLKHKHKTFSKKNSENLINHVKERIKYLKYFFENLENAILVEKTHENTKIKSQYLLVQTKDERFLHLGLLNVGWMIQFSGFEVLKEKEVNLYSLETYFSKKNNNYFEDSKLYQPILRIEKYDKTIGEYIPFSFDENKNKLLLEAYHKEKRQAKTLGEVAKEKATFLVSETREGNLSSMLKFYKTQINEEDSRTQDSVTKFEKRKDFER